MSKEERDIILEMVAENKISTAEAADLLDALTESEADERGSSAPDWVGAGGSETDTGSRFVDGHRRDRDSQRHEREVRRHERELEREARRRERESGRGRTSGRSLMIHVRDGDETRTHVHIPLGMALAAGKFIPKKARGYFDEYGIDLDDLLDTLQADLGRAGEIVNIRDGEKSIHISVVGSDPAPVVPPVAPAAPPTPPAD